MRLYSHACTLHSLPTPAVDRLHVSLMTVIVPLCFPCLSCENHVPLKNISQAPISSPTSQSSASSLNRQWLYLLPALVWIEKMMRYWNFLRHEQSNMQLLWNWPANKKIRASCLSSRRRDQLSALLDNGPMWSAIVMNWFQRVNSVFLFEHLGHAHLWNRYAQWTSRGWDV